MLNELYQLSNPVAFTLGGVSVRWYGIAYSLGFLIASIVMYLVARRWKIKLGVDPLTTLMLCVCFGVIFGARLGYCLFYAPEYFVMHPLDILNFSMGGMSFHGGAVGAILGGLLASHFTRVPFLTLADLVCIAAPIGLFLGRCANFVNGELWGAPTDLPWGVVFGGMAGNIPRHPSQLYEALLEGVVIFLILFLMSRKRPAFPRGTFSGTFLVLYGIFRFIVEFVRVPDAQLGYLWGGWLTMGQVLSVPFFILGIALLAYAATKKRPQRGTEKQSKPVEAATVPESSLADEGDTPGEAEFTDDTVLSASFEQDIRQ